MENMETGMKIHCIIKEWKAYADFKRQGTENIGI